MVDFNFLKYDIGGQDAIKGNGILEGSEVTQARNDGWNVFDGFKQGQVPTKLQGNSVFVENTTVIQAQEPTKAPQAGGVYAVYNQDGTTTVNYQNGKSIHLDKNGNEIKDTNAAAGTKENIINANGVKGSYSITGSDDGGYIIDSSNLSVLPKNPLKNKFLHAIPDVYDNEDGSVTISKLGLEATDFDEKYARQDLNNKVNQFVSDHAIYMDLVAKQNNGIQLSDAEQKFVNAHIEKMEKLDIKFDSNGNIIE